MRESSKREREQVEMLVGVVVMMMRCGRGFLSGDGVVFVRGVVEWVEGEKDPRCLILALRILGQLQVVPPTTYHLPPVNPH